MQHQTSTNLLEFITASKSKGASDEFLATFLTRRAWPQDDVFAALGAYWENATGLAIPGRAPGGESSRDAFLYLLSFATLATWTIALGSLLFRFIERWLPDPVTARQVYNLRNAVTWQMASAAVAFPIFLLVMRTILNEAQLHPERLQSAVRKWLTYVALLLTAGGIISDLICFFAYFLTGELTSRFFLKALTVLLICAAIFVYYLGSLRWDRHTDIVQVRRRSLKFALASALPVITCFAIGLNIAGTPFQQRQIEADNRRVQDLQAIARAIHFSYQAVGPHASTNTLPAALSQLIGKGIARRQTFDPETKQPYEYQLQTAQTYQLCATFASDQEPEQVIQSTNWHHSAGHSCFTLDASQQPLW